MRKISYKRIISIILMFTLCVQLFQTAQISAFAQETSTVLKSESGSIEEISESEENITEDISSDTEAETDIESTEETDMEETEEEFTEESVDDEMSEEEIESENENEIMLLAEGAESTPWEVIQANGVPKTPYAFGPGITYGEGETAKDSMELLKTWLESFRTTSSESIDWTEDVLNSMPLDSGEQLILLSVTDPKVYQNTDFKIGSATGAISLLGKVGDSTLTFQGLGSEDVPFQGEFASSSFTINRTLFNALDYKTANFANNEITVDWEGENSTGAILASKLINTGEKNLTVNINSLKNYPFRDAAFGEISGNLDLTISFQNNISFENKVNSDQNNAGMVANMVSSGTLKLTVSSFPGSITIGVNGSEEEKSNAGLLVGYLNNASLTLNNFMEFPTATIQAPQSGAGGIVGRIDNTDLSQITLTENIELNDVTILGKYTGGIAGYAQNVALDFGENKKLTLPASLGEKATNIIVGSGDISSQYTGGIFGWYDCGNTQAYTSYDGNGFSFSSDSIALHVNTTSGEAGGLFGHLKLGEDCNFFVKSKPESSLDINSKIVVADTEVSSVGGLIGKLEGHSKTDELIVENNVTVSVTEVTKDRIKYLGGLVGTVDQASVSVTNVSVKVPQPSATTYFGGLVASLGEDCVLKTMQTITVSTDSTAIKPGGGLVGEAKSASVVYLSGITDLRDVAYTPDGEVGQLVANQNSALIFATGSGNGEENDTWTYRRSTIQARVDDIGNYGQVIRLGDKLSPNLISIDDNNQVSFQLLDAEGNEKPYGTIDSADDFALHAIAFTTNNAFDLYNSTPPATIKKTNVVLSSDIDLSGTGIQGLTRDNGSDQLDGSTNGTGIGVTFDGNNHSLTINTGETYGLRNEGLATGEGSGQCYRHGYYGLLGKANSAIVENITITSTMNIGADVNTYAGAVFGWVNGGYSEKGSVNKINNVMLTDNSEIKLDGTPPKDNFSYVGGFIGYVAGDDTGVTVIDSSMQGDISYTDTSDSIILGGIVGKDNYSNSIDFKFENVMVGGSIFTNTTGNAHVGGLVAEVCASNAGNRNKNGATMSLKNVKVSSEITTSAATTSGGFLGYYWDNVDVTFNGNEENYAVATYVTKDNNTTASALNINSTNGAAVGGLCFAATGRWNMQGNVVDMGSASISNGSGDLGLIVCHGERQGSTPGSYTDGENAKALYLVMNTNWGTAYKNEYVTINDSPTIFDEIVAYTARSDKAAVNPVYDITRNDAGIISLHTDGDIVNMVNGNQNTYVNRTLYGKDHQTNPYSRYYYNLEIMTADGTNIDNPEELLLWSVRQYGATNIRKYLTVLDSSTITSNIITGILDMDGYSYYPVTVVNTDVDVYDATITFHNAEIEQNESGNKSTLDSNGRTQHFTMHSGLLLDYYTDSSAIKTATLTVKNLILLGTVGMVGGGSGGLISGKIYGYDGTKSVKLEMDTLKVDSEDKTKYFSVESFNQEYAPLLINSVGSFATLNISGISANISGENDTYTIPEGATSLIGNVGDKQAQSITLSFSKMKLPDTKGRFTKATMLHSFCYAQNSSAVYNFTKDEDWNGTEHIHGVTYGKEIGGTMEYANSASNPHQYWYAQSKINVSHSGEKFEGEERDPFNSYLPYVATSYKADERYHEIQVNSSLENINTGCGTYGDPYQISSDLELQSIAIYLSTGAASDGWTLNIPSHDDNGNSTFCKGENNKTHNTFVYKGGNWVQIQDMQASLAEGEMVTLSNDTVLTYLRNAYYQIINNITVNDFAGFGTQANPFRGVIVGKTGEETITLKGTLPQGFIAYSYGSVVKNVKFNIGTVTEDGSLDGTRTITFAEIKNNQGYTSESFYGGVIGCILGGDNIIDCVNVTYTDTPPVTLMEVNDSDKKKDHLIPVGGYVGVISGGGVIFRGSNTLINVPNSYVNDRNAYFYANSYVGRVLQGFAVQEGVSDTNCKLDNSEKNYQICQLNSTKTNIIDVDSSTSTITLKDAQALLVFSSITNSGGAGGGNVLPYFARARTCWNGTTFAATSVGGKVRNASYSFVGEANVTTDTPDYIISLNDDFAAVSASYLDTHYAGKKLFNVCGTSKWQINLLDGTYDMTAYGNGYRSISPRYLANAVCGSAIDSTVESNYQYLNPLISGFNGNGALIQTNIVSKEYVDDDHHAIAVGGVFNTVRFTNNAEMKNITIGGADEQSKGVILHEYYEWSNGNCNDATHKNWNGGVGFTNLKYEQGRGLVAIGGFSGNHVMDSGDKSISFKEINTQYLEMKGPLDAGGIIGHTGLRVSKTEAESNVNIADSNYHICYLIDKETPLIIPSFTNCSYKEVSIVGGMMVGGYIGIASYNEYAPINTERKIESINITFDENSDGKLGENSEIICQRPKTDSGIDDSTRIGNTSKLNCLPASGGLIGCSKLAVTIDNTTTAIIKNVDVRSSRSAGGVIAWPFSNVTIRNLSIIGKEDKNLIGDLLEYGTTSYDNDKVCEFSGGLIGYFEAGSNSLVVENCTVENLLIVASLRTGYPCYSGGIVGNIFSTGNHVIANCKVKNIKLANDTCSDTDIKKQYSYDGGLVGRLQQGQLYGSNLLIDSIESVKKVTKDQHGNLIGMADSGRLVYLAGVSIQNTKNLNSILQTDIGGTKPVKCYVAYADYSGMAQDAENQGNVSSTSAEPYATTSPKGVKIPVSAADESGNKQTMFLYGDGANPEIVKNIDNEKGNGDNKKFYYALTSSYSFNESYSSDFYSEMGLSEETAGDIPNFPVLQVPVANKTAVSTEIVHYLNLVTNNGYAIARDTNVGASSHVEFSIDLYRWNEKGGYFEKNPSDTSKAFSGNGVDFETSFTNYDSGKNQFELLSITFTEEVKINSKTYSYEYIIQIPIVVRRMLEVDFTATLKDSPSFKEKDYEVYNLDGFKSNITVGYGTSVSALLTYTYNSAFGEQQTYGWQTYLDNGGFMGDPGQMIQFYNPNSKLKSLPVGTQLVLLDCADNNKAYKYEVLKQSEETGTNIQLSDFADSNDSSYSSRWLSEIMDVKAKQSNSGEWILLDNGTDIKDAKARIRKENGYQYFRPKTKDDTDTSKFYHLTADEIQPKEQFYLVIYIPESSVEGIPETTETEGKNLNGYIFTSLPGLTSSIACNINAVRVKQDGTIVTDTHSSSESTYNFLSGYTQSLSDQSSDKEQRQEADPEAYILLDQPESDGNYLLHMDLVDEITVVKGQKDTADTPLYFKENVSLPNYAKAENDTVSLVTANGFPTGCYGTVEFYVYLDNNGNKTYYESVDDKWVSTSGKEKALSYDWNSNGGNMELYLGTENKPDKAVTLAAIRELAKKSNEKFYVETKIDIHMSVPAAEQVIAGAITKGNAFTRLSYTTYLASAKNSFSNTNYVESKQGEVRYYQSRSGNSTLTHSANDPTQLGINCSDLASANGVIFTTGVYDLTTVSNAEKLIDEANKVAYTLTLWQRQEDGSYDQIRGDLGKYIRSVRMDDQTVLYTYGYHGYRWTDKKSDTGFASMDPENSKRFLLPIRVEVNTDVETNSVTFANYQLRLTATLYNGDNILDQPINSEIMDEGNTKYIRYDYVTYTITRILTDGYWEDTNSGTP